MSEADRVKWDDRYREGSYSGRTHPTRLLERHIESLERGRALDVACGTGRNARFLAAAGFEVDAIDISAAGLERARAAAATEGLDIHWIEADLERGVPPEVGLEQYELIVMVRYVNIPLIGALRERLSSSGVFLCEQHLQSARTVAGPRSDRFRLRSNELLRAAAGLQVRLYREGVMRDPDDRSVALAQLIACRDTAFELIYC